MDRLKVIVVIASFVIVAAITLIIAGERLISDAAAEPLRADNFAQSIELCTTEYGHDNAQLRACVEASLATNWGQ